MPVEERIQLVEDVWDSIAELPESVSMPDWHKEELEKRLSTYRENPAQGTPWGEIRDKLLNR